MIIQKWILQVRVTRAQHCGEPRRLHLAPFAFAGLLEVPVIAYNLQRPFAVDFFLQSPQGLLYWLAFFQFDFCQLTHFLPGTLDLPATPAESLQSSGGAYFLHNPVSIGKSANML